MYCLPARHVLIRILFISSLIATSTANAHFVWLKTSPSGSTANAVLSFGESPAEEDYHLPEAILDIDIFWRGKTGKTHALVTEHIDTEDRVVLEAGLPSGDARVLEATCTYGVYGSSLLKYYPKHVHCFSTEELGEFGPSTGQKLDLVPEFAKTTNLSSKYCGTPRRLLTLSSRLVIAQMASRKQPVMPRDLRSFRYRLPD